MTHTLLLADDSVTIQRVIELTFAEEDVDVVAVSDGDQAIQRLESAPPDIVLADIGMPGRDGYEVARYIRQTPKLAHIPIVLLTGAFEPVDQAKAAEVGCDGVLAKPFEPQLVIGRVKELLSGQSRKAPRSIDDVLPVPVAAAAAPSPEQHAQNLDEYFDRLDNAFASLGGQSGAAAAPSPERPVAPDLPEPPARSTSMPDHIESFAAPRDLQPSSDPDLPLSYASPVPAVFAVPPPAVPEPPPAPRMEVPAPLPAIQQGPRELPSVTDAFAAILAAEQSGSESPRPVWPSNAVPAAAAAASPASAISDDVIEQIVGRVLERIAVGDRVAEVAERLVRQEIDRIKASVK